MHDCNYFPSVSNVAEFMGAIDKAEKEKKIS